LSWWAGAATIDLVGTWLGHPLPGRVLRSENVAFDAEHMIERCRLFLLIALGESVVTTGTAIADAPQNLITIMTGTCALIAIVALWDLHFGVSDRLLDRYVAATSNPIFAARRTVNGLLIVVAGLIALAVGNELVIAYPHGHASVTVSLLLFGGPLLYLFSQTWYLWTVIGIRSVRRFVGMGVLVVAGGLSLFLPPFVSLGLLTVLLAAIIASFLHGERRASSRLLAHQHE
jgi:low temperature requirement protein LtrA